MSSNSRREDYILRLKLDARTLEREYPKVFAKMQKAQARQAAAARRDTQASVRDTRDKISLMRQQERLAAKIAQAERQGTQGINKYRQMSRSSRPEVLAMADIGLTRANRLRAAEIRSLNEEQAKQSKRAREEAKRQVEEARNQARIDRENIRNGTRRSKARAKAKREALAAERAAVNNTNRERQRSVTILQQQERLLARIARAEQAGVDGLGRYRQMANSRRGEVLGRANAELSRSMRNSRGVGGAEQLSVDIQGAQRRAYSVGPQFQDQLQGNLGRLNEIGDRLRTARTTRQVRELRQEYSEVRSEIRGIEREQARYNRTVARSSSLVQRFSTSVRHMGLRFASVYAAIAGGKAVFSIGKDMDGMRAGLLAASNSAAEAGENFEFLKNMSQELGRDLQAGTNSFNRLAIAARGAGYTTEEAREIFRGISESATTSQLSIDKTNLAMLAMSQMMSKGKVSSEELSRQLAEQIPATMKAAEMATGKTTRELLDMMKAGKLLSKDFVLPFARAMSKMARANGALEVAMKKVGSEQTRAKNALVEMIDDIFQGGAGDVFSKWFRMFTQAMEHISPTVTKMSITVLSVFDTLVQSFGATIVALDAIDKIFSHSGKSVSIMKIALNSLMIPLNGIATLIYGLLSGFYRLIAVKDKFFADKVDKKAHAELLAQEARVGFNLGPVNPATGKRVSVGTMNITSNKADSKEVADEVMQRFSEEVAN